MQRDKAALIASLAIDESSRGRAGTENRLAIPLGVGVLIGGLLGAFLVYWLKPASAGSRAPARAAVQTSAPGAQTGRAPGALVGSGYVVARRKATVAAEITGRLTDVRVEEGQTVHKGQLLALLDAGLADADVRIAKSRADAAAAAVRTLEAQLADAQRIAERSDALARRGFSTNADQTRNRTQVASIGGQAAKARADLSAALSDFRRSRFQRSKYEIRAPFTGIVIDKNAQAGEIISPISAGGGFTRTGICTVVDMSSLEIEVDVSEQYIGRVHPGQRVEAVLEAYPNVRHAAYVIALIPTADRSKSSVRVRIGFDKIDKDVLPDMAVNVSFL